MAEGGVQTPDFQIINHNKGRGRIDMREKSKKGLTLFLKKRRVDQKKIKNN